MRSQSIVPPGKAPACAAGARHSPDSGGKEIEGRVLFLLRKMDSNDGITSYCQTLAGGLKAAGVPVDLVTGGIYCEAGQEHRWDAVAEKLSGWKVLPRLRKIPDPGTLLALRRYMRDRGVGAINIHGLGMLIWGKLLSIVTGVPVVATYHPSTHGALEQVAELSGRRFSLTERMVLRWCAPDRLVVVSSESAAYLGAQCPAIRDRIVVVYGAVDDAHFRPPGEAERRAARSRFGLADDELAILLVGRLSWNKGHDMLIDAVRMVRERHVVRRIRCFFVGTGGQGAEIEARALQSEEDRATFHFLGFIKVREVIWASDIFALPSRFEGCALAVVEAMCAGLAAIRTPSGGTADQILHGETGLIVPFEDTEKLAAAIGTLADPATRARISAQGTAFARHRFAGATMAARMIAIYQEVAVERGTVGVGVTRSRERPPGAGSSTEKGTI